MARIRDQIGAWLAEFHVPFHLRSWKWIRLAIFVCLDLLCIAIALWCAYALRLDDWRPVRYLDTIRAHLKVIALCSIPLFFFLGMYRQVWRFANFNSALVIVQSVIFSTSLSFLAVHFVVEPFPPAPRSVYVIYAMIAIGIIASIRFSWRSFATFQSRYNKKNKGRCLIYGAGSAGDILARHIKANPAFPYFIVGFIDDDNNKRRRILHDFVIWGSGEELESLCNKHNIDTILIALPSAPGKVIREIVKKCQNIHVKPLIMADLGASFTEGVIRPREVDVADLLRRSPKKTDQGLIGDFFNKETVLITGAGGSIGSELTKQILDYGPKRVVLLDSSEFNLYQVDMLLRELAESRSIELVCVLGSVTEPRLVNKVFAQHNPKLVLHTAAYKHVPLVEANPCEGILNNILGTKTVAEAAIAHGVKRFLLVSTDKAVRPTNVMGASKRACEILIQALHQVHQQQCRFSIVRFGNVLGSSGSVIPLFLSQIAHGGPVTVTHPEVTRYFMLISEAVALVLQSIAMSKGGETFVLNMGEPVKIYEMAQQLILLAGKTPGKDIEIKVTGLRPGEKLYEELILEGSESHTTHEDVFVARPESFDAKDCLKRVNAIIEAAVDGRDAEAVQAVRRIANSGYAQPVGDDQNRDPQGSSLLN